jgi:DNA-binding CsgD family transcriptional regulator
VTGRATLVGADPVPVPSAFAPYLPPALAELSVPAYVVDRGGTIRWLNRAAQQIVGDKVGDAFVEVVDMDGGQARKVFDTHVSLASGGDTTTTLVAPDGRRTRVDISSVPLGRHHHVLGMFGLAIPTSRRASTGAPTPLTRRQQEILELLADGVSTAEMAKGLFLSEQTVRNHVREILQRLGVKSRLAAVAVARRDGLV